MSTEEEYKTALGQLLVDIAGDWNTLYLERLELANNLSAKIHPLAKDVRELIRENKKELYEGRIFDMCNIYGYISHHGNTNSVRRWLKKIFLNPQNCKILN